MTSVNVRSFRPESAPQHKSQTCAPLNPFYPAPICLHLKFVGQRRYPGTTIMASILLQGGTLLLHDENDHINPVVSDLLIEGNKIVKIAPNIKPAENVRLIDCRGKIVSPGFVDTHRHMWQTQLKGRHANETLFEYLPTGNMAASLYS